MDNNERLRLAKTPSQPKTIQIDPETGCPYSRAAIETEYQLLDRALSQNGVMDTLRLDPSHREQVRSQIQAYHYRQKTLDSLDQQVMVPSTMPMPRPPPSRPR